VISVLMVDDHEMFRTGMRRLLSMFDDIEVVGEATDGREAIAQAERLRPDVVLMDLRMPEIDGIEATREITARFPAMRVLVVTTFDEDDLVTEAIAAGACGYVLKAMPSEDIAHLIRLCARGYQMFGPGVGGAVRLPAPGGSVLEAAGVRLSEREFEVLRLVGRGFTNREIAEELVLSEGTVRNYVSGLLGRFNAKHRTELALTANAILARIRLRSDEKPDGPAPGDEAVRG
jgi:DNA-binding NarL/FixJ family response regulator